MRIFIVPLNWGLGHATRCIPLVQRYLNDGAEVVLGGTGESLRLLRRYFPNLRYLELAPLELRYSPGKRQVWAMLRALPQLWRFARTNRRMVELLTAHEHFDLIISDNCFGVYSDKCDCVYITHQLHIMFPRPWRWLEPLAARLHARAYAKYKEVWILDYATDADSPLGFTLSGKLGHPKKTNINCQLSIINYIAPLSRFSLNSEAINPRSGLTSNSEAVQTVAIVSGLEPHRTIFENELRARFADAGESFVIYTGNSDIPVEVLLNAEHIIARSGYSTIMDLAALGVLHKAELHPTPGQTEQEYLARHIQKYLHK